MLASVTDSHLDNGGGGAFRGAVLMPEDVSRWCFCTHMSHPHLPFLHHQTQLGESCGKYFYSKNKDFNYLMHSTYVQILLLTQPT